MGLPTLGCKLKAGVGEGADGAEYVPYIEEGIFVANPDGSEYIGMVWPGYTVFQDWFHKNTQQWWTDSLRNWSIAGLEFSGIWFDMNEASSFCDGSCGTGVDLTKPILPFILPGEPGNIMSDYPECYDSRLFGPSGNITVNGFLTCVLEPRESAAPVDSDFDTSRRTGQKEGFDLNEPPYAIHNFNGRLSVRALATNVSHAGGEMELDVHNIWGLMAGRATYLALQDIIPGKRPFLFSRSTFPSSGRWTGHWLGDNYSLWSYLRSSIPGVLQFQLFQIPFVGADTCGFIGNTNEELCNRWMSLSAFTPFFRNHNIQTALSQEPYRWDSVANASRIAIGVRYSLLPYWYTLFANSSTFGTPPVRALFFEFPDEPELFGVDEQFLVGGDILVTPVLRPNVSYVTGFLPGRGNVIWRDWYTHESVGNTPGEPVALAAPLSHINVQIRDGSIILLHAKPAYTIEETRQGPYSLLVSQSSQGLAFGTAYVDDGISSPPVPNRILKFLSTPNEVIISSAGDFTIEQKLTDIMILGVNYEPTSVLINGRMVGNWTYGSQQRKLVAHEIDADLNAPISLQWIGGLDDFQVDGVWLGRPTNSSNVQ